MVRVGLRGVGYRFWRLGHNRLLFDLGYNRFLMFVLPKLVGFGKVGKHSFSLIGPSFRVVGSVLDSLKRLPPYNPYTGKGVVVNGVGVPVRLRRKKKNVLSKGFFQIFDGWGW